MKQKSRNEVSSNDKWDLTPIYKTDESFLKDLNNVKEEIKSISQFENKLTENNVLEYLNLYYSLEKKVYKLYYYASLNFDSDTTNNKYEEYRGLVKNLINDFDSLTSFASSEILNLDINKINIDEDNKFTIKELFRTKEHILPSEIEKILSNFSLSLSSSENTYEAITDSDMKFPNIINEKGEEVEFTESNYSNFIQSEDRNIRKKAFEILFNTYKTHKYAITSCFNGYIDSLISLRKIRKYNSTIEMSLDDDNIKESVYENMCETVSNNLKTLHKYYQLKKDILNLEDINIYDMYTELVKDYNKNYTFEEAKQVTLDSLQILGEDYVSKVKRAFDENWIDIYNNKGKRSGAYSSGFYDINPYILLNFEGKIKDVSTLTHEIGHSMHSLYSWENNCYQNSSYKIFVAEVASTVNELLLNYHMLENSNNKEEKKYIINSLMELFKGTIYRQVMFAIFERKMHNKKEKGEILTSKQMSEDYLILNKKFFGENVEVDELIKYEWMRIPHFYYDFYVYKYAIGLCSACHIVKNIKENKPNAIENYISFLKSGGSDYPEKILEKSGININNKEYIESAIEMFDKLIDEFKQLMEE